MWEDFIKKQSLKLRKKIRSIRLSRERAFKRVIGGFKIEDRRKTYYGLVGETGKDFYLFTDYGESLIKKEILFYLLVPSIALMSQTIRRVGTEILGRT